MIGPKLIGNHTFSAKSHQVDSKICVPTQFQHFFCSIVNGFMRLARKKHTLSSLRESVVNERGDEGSLSSTGRALKQANWAGAPQFPKCLALLWVETK